MPAERAETRREKGARKRALRRNRGGAVGRRSPERRTGFSRRAREERTLRREERASRRRGALARRRRRRDARRSRRTASPEDRKEAVPSRCAGRLRAGGTGAAPPRG